MTTLVLLPRHKVLYCGACGMPIEYCEYGPDYETHCIPWLQKNQHELYIELYSNRKSNGITNNNKPLTDTTTATTTTTTTKTKIQRPDEPRTIKERLVAFYWKYEPSKVDTIDSLLTKYSGKEEQLFLALTKKYGEEPHDPYYTDSDDDDDDEDNNNNHADNDNDNDDQDDNNNEDDDDDDNINTDTTKKGKRRGASAKKNTTIVPCKIIIIKQTQKKKRCLTVVNGMDTIPPSSDGSSNIKLKDVTKLFSKTFAGSSSIKDNNSIIIQGDHIFDVAELLIDKFHISTSCIYFDFDNNHILTPYTK